MGPNTLKCIRNNDSSSLPSVITHFLMVKHAPTKSPLISNLQNHRASLSASPDTYIFNSQPLQDYKIHSTHFMQFNKY